MPNTLAHIAIEAENVDRARDFYAAVFGWDFEPWGPPEFYLIHGLGIKGALQKRTKPMTDRGSGIECTFAVDDLRASLDQIGMAGGTVLGSPFEITGVGTLCKFLDTEGNELIVMQFD